MKTFTDNEIKVLGTKVPQVASTQLSSTDSFLLVEASNLSFKDEFMKYTPQTREQEILKGSLTKIMLQGCKDFYAPKYDPSFDENGEIHYKSGEEPALGKSCRWWKIEAKNFKPESKSHLGTYSERVAFLGCFIKKLVESGWTAQDAWHAVCNNSVSLGHYWNSENTSHTFEKTGSREVLGFCDLSNTRKLLVDDRENYGFTVTGGYYFVFAHCNPLAHFDYDDDLWDDLEYAVGWILLEK